MERLNQNSIDAVARASVFGSSVRPLYQSYCFSELPQIVIGLLNDNPTPIASELSETNDRLDNVVLVLVDGMGWELLKKHLERTKQPLLNKLAKQALFTKFTSQFPATTSAHICTIQSGLPVTESGVCEWNYYEPTVNRVICPLLFCLPGERTTNTLSSHGITAEQVFPQGRFMEELIQHGITPNIFVTEGYLSSPFSTWFCKGGQLLPHRSVEAGLELLSTRLLSASGKNYFYFYFPGVDEAAHTHGAESNDVAARLDYFFSVFEKLFLNKVHSYSGRTLLLFTADHGETSINPATTVYLDRSFPDLVPLLKVDYAGNTIAPCGGPRDYLLHVLPEKNEEALAILRSGLEGRAEVYTQAQLRQAGVFGPCPSQRFLERIGDIIILPHSGQSVYWLGRNEKFRHRFQGHHGGLSRQEMEIPVISLLL